MSEITIYQNENCPISSNCHRKQKKPRNSTDEEIDCIARDAMYDEIEWSYEVVEVED